MQRGVKGKLTTLGRAEVLARSGSAGAGATGLLDGEGATLQLLALQCLLGSIGLLRSHEVDETEAARLLGVWVAHDLALLDVAVLGEKASNLLLAELGVNASDEQVGARVGGTLAIPGATVILHVNATVNWLSVRSGLVLCSVWCCSVWRICDGLVR